MSYPHYTIECGEHHDLVVDFNPDVDSRDRAPRPPIVCLCGSTRFADEFRLQNLRLTLAGVIVLSVGCDTKSDADLAAAGEQLDKHALDELHKRKIDLADSVLVLDVGGYIGASTRSEIAYAKAHGKTVDYLSDVDDKAAES